MHVGEGAIDRKEAITLLGGVDKVAHRPGHDPEVRALGVNVLAGGVGEDVRHVAGNRGLDPSFVSVGHGLLYVLLPGVAKLPDDVAEALLVSRGFWELSIVLQK